ncbi:MAG: metallophosphoesterase [Oscillospiraceae bacterium]|nr:metallophosphoesterase [Oscillospiraceae bacterium]
MTKKSLAILLSVAVLLAGFALPAGALDTAGYKILVFSDVHQKAADDPNLYAFMDTAIKANEPDLVILLGDVADPADRGGTMEALRQDAERILAPIIANGAKFAYISGNHDHDELSDSTRASLGGTHHDVLKAVAAVYRELGGDLYAECDAVSDYGGDNQLIYIRDAAGEVAASLVLFDLGEDGSSADSCGYTPISSAQQAWFMEVRAEYPDVPCYVFQHIPMPEVYDYYPTVPASWAAPLNDFCAKVDDALHISFRELVGVWEGRTVLYLPNFFLYEGVILEHPCPPSESLGEFETLRDDGNVVAVFSGHDHMNNFKIHRGGMDMWSIAGCAWLGSNANHYYRGASLITINPQRPGAYTTSRYTYEKAAAEPGAPTIETKKDNESIFSDILVWFEVALSVAGTPLRWLVDAFN